MTKHTNIPRGDRPMFNFIKNYLDGKKILDMGCGNCTFISFFKIQKNMYLGIDVDRLKCADAKKKKYPVLCKNVEDYCATLNNEKFEVVLAKDILEHCNNPLKVMTRINKNLTADGNLFISVPSELSLLIWDDYTHKRGFSKRALKELLNDSGFEIIRLRNDHSLINFKNCPIRYFSLFILEKITKLDLITQNYLVHAKKSANF